jgi:hypothetical protein
VNPVGLDVAIFTVGLLSGGGLFAAGRASVFGQARRLGTDPADDNCRCGHPITSHKELADADGSVRYGECHDQVERSVHKQGIGYRREWLPCPCQQFHSRLAPLPLSAA